MTKASNWAILSMVASLGLSLCAAPSFADQYSGQEPGTAADTNGATYANQNDLTRGYLHNEVIGIKPQVGVVNFIDSMGNVANRGAAGFTLDMNATGWATGMVGMNSPTDLYIGPSVGLFYSHIGNNGGNIFGSGDNGSGGSLATTGGDSGANLFIVPTDLKIGWNMGNFRLSVHGGGNVMYRNVANSVLVGLNPSASNGSDWSIFPNAGADIEFGANRAVAGIIRPDWTIAGPNRLFSLTAGLSFPIG